MNRYWLVVVTAVSGWALWACDVTGPPEGYVFFKVRFRGDVGMIVGADTYVTRDGGRSWQRHDFGGRLRQEDYMLRYRKQIQLFSDGTILHSLSDTLTKVTADGRVISSSSLPSTGFQFSFRDREVALGATLNPGLMFRTLDGGSNWQETFQIPESLYMISVIWLSDEQIYLLTYTELLLSTDGGQSWEALTEFGSPLGMKYRAGKLWITNGNQLVTYDLATSTESVVQEFDTLNVMDIHFCDDNILALGSDGRFYTGNPDRGWQETVIPMNFREVQLFSFDFAPDGSLWVVGGKLTDFGTGSRIVWTSSDLKNWRRVDFP